MDTRKAIDFLREFRDQVERIDSRSTINSSIAVQAVQEMESTAAMVIDAIFPGLGSRMTLEKAFDGIWYTADVLETTNRAIGHLEHSAQRAAIFSNKGPQLAAESLHPWVWAAAASLWETGHRREAVQAAATLVNANVQAKVKRRDVSDSDLMNQIFSKDSPDVGKPRLRWPGEQTDKRVVTMNNGLRGFAAGVFQTIRNSASHDLTDIPQQVALEQLAALSLMARWIEHCVLATVPVAASVPVEDGTGTDKTD